MVAARAGAAKRTWIACHASPEERPLRKVHTADSILEVAHLRNVLETEGIACVIRNDRLAGALGEIPFVECWPELWVVENLFAIKARELIRAAQAAGPARAADWVCAQCGEPQDAQFDACWRCAADPRGEADS